MSGGCVKQPSKIESIAGHIATEGALTVVGAVSGGALAPLLPILAKSLASERQKRRIEQAISEIEAVLTAHEAALQNITDEQYKLINESILALFHSTSAAKVKYLQRVVANGIAASNILSQESVFLARVVRDISAEEADFLLRNFHYERVQVSSSADGDGQSHLRVGPDTPDGLAAMGLVSLGILTAAEPNWDDSGMLRFTPVTAKLIALLREPPS
jgi:hypothetical protein